ncbi:MAG: DegV family protein [Oscillospiraceae bacterium]|nr:DegV family protein [Oscillospiraceae bacterium]
MKIKISADSTLDLTPEIIAAEDIGVVPMTVVLGDTQYKDGVDITPDMLFAHVDGGGSSHTSAINAEEYAEHFDKYLLDHDAVVHITISSGLSACYQDACLAAEGKPVYIVDSKNLSSSGGILALRARELVSQGFSASEIADKLRGLVPKISANFVIDSLKYLHKGGRCSGVAALGANILRLKPCIEVRADEGKMEVGKKYRGSFETVILQYIEDQLANRGDVDTSIIAITRATGVTEEILASVRSKIAEHCTFDRVIETFAGCTISNHCGPVCLGILFLTK